MARVIESLIAAEGDDFSLARLSTLLLYTRTCFHGLSNSAILLIDLRFLFPFECVIGFLFSFFSPFSQINRRKILFDQRVVYNPINRARKALFARGPSKKRKLRSKSTLVERGSNGEKGKERKTNTYFGALVQLSS